MSAIGIFWVVGCVVSFICGLLTPYFSKQKKFTSTDLLYAVVCGCGSWLYAIIFIFGVSGRKLFPSLTKIDDTEPSDEGLTYYQIVNALRANPFDQLIHSKYIIEFTEDPREKIEHIIKGVVIKSEKGWNYGTPTVHYTDCVAVAPLNLSLYRDDEDFMPIPYGEKIHVRTEHTKFDDFKFEYNDIHTASELECVKAVLASDMRTNKSLYSDTISFSVNEYDITLRNTFASSQTDNVVSFNYDFFELRKEI